MPKKEEKDKDTEKSLKDKKKDKNDGETIVITDFLGCPKKNKRKKVLTQLQCKGSFFRAIKRFLLNNDKNKVVFIGEYFGLGAYVVDVIMSIVKLKKRFENRVKIVLGANDINKLRFKYELDRDLLKEDISNWPDSNFTVETKYDKKGKGFEFGRNIDIYSRIEKVLKRRNEKSLLVVLYERIKDIIMKTQGGKMEYSFLVDKNLSDLYFLAEDDQNIELQIYSHMIGAFIIVFPFVHDVKYENYISKQEIQYMIDILLENMEKNITNELSYRDDVYIRNIYELFEKVKFINKKQDYKYGFSCDLNKWREGCNYLFKHGKLIEQDFIKSRTIYTHNNSFFYLFETFLPFLRYQFRKSKRETGSKSLKENYYKQYNEIYNDFMKIKGIKELFEIDKKILEDEKEYSKEEVELTQKDLRQEEFFQFHNVQNMLGGSDKSIKANRKKDFKEKYKDENLNDKELKIMNDLRAYPKGDNINDTYIDCDFKFLVEEINLYYRQQIIEVPSMLKDSRYISIFIALQVIYIIIQKTSNNYNYLHPYNLAKFNKIRKILYHKSYYNIVIAGYTTGLHFPLVIENIYSSNLIFPSITLVKKKEIPIYKFSKMMLSDREDFKFKINLRIKNFPIISLTHDGDVKITSITNSGNITNKKTFLGEYFSHTFEDLFLSHRDKVPLDIKDYEKVRINMSLLREQVNANQLPLFKSHRTDMSFERTYLTQDLTYFIKLKSKSKDIHNLYLIFDLRNRGEIKKIGSYFGDISEWLGFFWNEKKLYQKSINKQDFDYFKRFLRYHTARKINLFYDTKRKYKQLKPIIDLMNNRITSKYFKKYITQGFTPEEDFNDISAILPNIDIHQTTHTIESIVNDNTRIIGNRFNELINDVLNFYDPHPYAEMEVPPAYSEIDNAHITVTPLDNDNNRINIPYIRNRENNISNVPIGGRFSYNIMKRGGASNNTGPPDKRFFYNEITGDILKDELKLNDILITIHLSHCKNRDLTGLLGINLIKFYNGVYDYKDKIYFYGPKLDSNNKEYTLKDYIEEVAEVAKLKEEEEKAIKEKKAEVTKAEVLKDLKIIINKIFEGIEYLKEKGICHLDIQPINILLSIDNKRIKICNFKNSVKFKTGDKIDKYIYKNVENTDKKDIYGFSPKSINLFDSYKSKINTEDYDEFCLNYLCFEIYKKINKTENFNDIDNKTDLLYDILKIKFNRYIFDYLKYKIRELQKEKKQETKETKKKEIDTSVIIDYIKIICNKTPIPDNDKLYYDTVRKDIIKEYIKYIEDFDSKKFIYLIFIYLINFYYNKDNPDPKLDNIIKDFYKYSKETSGDIDKNCSKSIQYFQNNLLSNNMQTKFTTFMNINPNNVKTLIKVIFSPIYNPEIDKYYTQEGILGILTKYNNNNTDLTHVLSNETDHETDRETFIYILNQVIFKSIFTSMNEDIIPYEFYNIMSSIEGPNISNFSTDNYKSNKDKPNDILEMFKNENYYGKSLIDQLNTSFEKEYVGLFVINSSDPAHYDTYIIYCSKEDHKLSIYKYNVSPDGSCLFGSLSLCILIVNYILIEYVKPDKSIKNILTDLKKKCLLDDNIEDNNIEIMDMDEEFTYEKKKEEELGEHLLKFFIKKYPGRITKKGMATSDITNEEMTEMTEMLIRHTKIIQDMKTGGFISNEKLLLKKKNNRKTIKGMKTYSSKKSRKNLIN